MSTLVFILQVIGLFFIFLSGYLGAFGLRSHLPFTDRFIFRNWVKNHPSHFILNKIVRKYYEDFNTRKPASIEFARVLGAVWTTCSVLTICFFLPMYIITGRADLVRINFLPEIALCYSAGMVTYLLATFGHWVINRHAGDLYLPELVKAREYQEQIIRIVKQHKKLKIFKADLKKINLLVKKTLPGLLASRAYLENQVRNAQSDFDICKTKNKPSVSQEVLNMHEKRLQILLLSQQIVNQKISNYLAALDSVIVRFNLIISQEADRNISNFLEDQTDLFKGIQVVRADLGEKFIDIPELENQDPLLGDEIGKIKS